MKTSLTERRLLILIVALGFLARAGAALHFTGQGAAIDYFGYDESVYYSLARHMAGTTPFSYTLQGAELYFQDYRIWYVDAPLFHHPPLFVWLLYLWQRLLGSDVLLSRMLNVLIGTVTIYVVYLIGRRVSGYAGLLSAAFISLSAISIQQSGLLLMDSLLAMLTAAFILSVIRFSEDGTWTSLCLSIAALALSMWTRYTGSLAASFLIVYGARKKIGWKDSLKTVGAALLLFTPWLLWNHRVYGMAIPIGTWQRIASWPQVPLPIYAYVAFLPVVAPFAVLGFLGLFRTGRDALKEGLAALVLLYLITFSIPAEKEMRFILPAIAPLSILAADYVDGVRAGWRRPLSLLAIAATAASAYVVVRAGYYWYLPFWHYHELLPGQNPFMSGLT
ncbi:MAG: hypothetical protein D6733_03175 [Methanobacteriota archaeon]|nr:MAG: hypothetical protein D6733_03175 [Euryarchaeota archaeon]